MTFLLHSAQHAIKALVEGDLSATDLAHLCLLQIQEREPTVGAWHYFKPELVRQQAEQSDQRRQQGQSGALEGLPIAIKDVFATADMPTGWGTPIHAGRMLSYDAAVVERLRHLGAIIVGKTVTTEYAMARAGKTHNPHQLSYSPGGSSSGSAAAVAAGMVPLALGTQTLGSVIRPAAYCGVVGFKPSFGSLSRYGVQPVSRDLDHVGLFAHSVDDVALLYSMLAIADSRDPDCVGAAPVQAQPVSNLRIALVKTPMWLHATDEMQQHVLRCASVLSNAGMAIAEVELPSQFSHYLDYANTLACAGLAANHGQDYDQHHNQMSEKLRQLIERGRNLSALSYADARHVVIDYRYVLSRIFNEYDVILTPATVGSAPSNLEDTGSPIFCSLWTLCGLPAISIPSGTALNGLPLAIQLVGNHRLDNALLNCAALIHHELMHAA